MKPGSSLATSPSTRRSQSCSRTAIHRFRPLPTPASMQFALFPFQERGHGWLRMLGDLGVGGILADDMGLGKTVQAIAMLASEREEPGGDALGPTLVVCPMSVVKQWCSRSRASRPRCACTSTTAASGSRHCARGSALASDVVVTSYDIATRDVDSLAAIPGTGCCSTRRRTSRTRHEARTRAAPAAGAPRLAMTGTPIENRLERAVGDHGHRQPGPARLARWFERSFARPIETHSHDGRWSVCGRSCSRSSSAAPRTRPRSSWSCRRSRSPRTTAG
jgi:hypothetical protein